MCLNFTKSRILVILLLKKKVISYVETMLIIVI